MKHSRFFIFLIATLFFGCAKEYSYEGGNKYRKCIACSYLPMCDSSVFVYVDSTSSVPDTLSGTVFIGNDTVLNGKRYTSVSGFAALNNGLLYNCDNGDYQLLLSLSAFGVNIDSVVDAALQTLPLPFPITAASLHLPKSVRTSVLKTNQPVNGTWTDTIYTYALPPFLSFYAGIDYKIIEKNVQRTVFQKVYTDVTHVRGSLNAVSTLGNLPFGLVIDFYFARDVGLIELRAENNGVLQRVTRLYSYTL